MNVYDSFRRRCRHCGCDDYHACYDPVLSGGCAWYDDSLCTVCARNLGVDGAARAAVPPSEAQAIARRYADDRRAWRRQLAIAGMLQSAALAYWIVALAVFWGAP